jgi:uncharacterized protein
MVFGKVPRLGEGLTEISKAYGPQAAFKLQRTLLDLSLEQASKMKVRKWFRYPIGSSAPSLGADWDLRPHEPGNEGELVTRGMNDAFSRGFGSVVTFYADCPSLVPEFLESAFELLEGDTDLVLGPTFRGGLYLIGASRPVGDLFAKLPWRTDRLYQAALHAATEKGWSVESLPRKDSVETMEDWVRAAGEGWIPPPPTIEGGSGRPEG